MTGAFNPASRGVLGGEYRPDEPNGIIPASRGRLRPNRPSRIIPASGEHDTTIHTATTKLNNVRINMKLTTEQYDAVHTAYVAHYADKARHLIQQAEAGR